MKKRKIALLLGLLGGLAACSSADRPADASLDAGVDATAADLVVDSPADLRATPDLGAIPFVDPFPKPSADPLAGGAVEGCARYQRERCKKGTLQRCALYDTTTKTFVTAPDPLLERVLRYERWYDLYHSPDGMSFSRHFNQATLAGTPEATWGDPARFARWGNEKDVPIWSGVALIGHALRYVSTRTQADYQRMERKARALLTHFEMSGAAGYLGRYHFLAVPPGTPMSDQHVLHEERDFGYKVHALDLQGAAAGALPAVYSQGVPDGKGGTVKGRPLWYGNPSIDQYSGALSAFATVWPLLEDAQLQGRIAHHVSCFLKRLRRIEIRNLQKNPEMLSSLTAFFAGAGLELDPGDIDLSKTETAVLYVLEQSNSKNTSFDSSCRADVELTASRVIDAASKTFLADALFLIADLRGGEDERATGYDLVYAPNIRGGNAIQLMQLAVAAYRMTGDPQFEAFFRQELIGRLRALDLADTASALLPPPWCRAFHGDHITYLPLWSLLSMLGPSAVRARLEQTLGFEFYDKRMRQLDNANFELYFAGVAPQHEDAAGAAARATAALATLGGNGGVLDDPRRSYTLDRQWMIANLPSGTTTRCPTEAERALCEDGVTVFGLPLPGEPITHPCEQVAGECKLSTGCAWALASKPLPLEHRGWGDFIWQKTPFALGQTPAIEGQIQSAGIELFQSFWLARAYGLISVGEGQVLAWRDVGSCP